MKKMVFLDEASCNLVLQQPRSEFPRQWETKKTKSTAQINAMYPEVDAKSNSPGNIEELGEC